LKDGFDVHDYERRMELAVIKLKENKRVDPHNRIKIFRFLDYAETQDLSLPRRIRYLQNLTFSEAELQPGVEALRRSAWLRWREGLHDDPVVEKIVTQLSHEERYHLAKVIVAFNEAGAPPYAILTSPLTNLLAEQASVVEKVRRLSRETELLS
jgi:hypothetical protein